MKLLLTQRQLQRIEKLPADYEMVGGLHLAFWS